MVKDEFRAGLALVRVAESSVTALAYYKLGLFIAESGSLLLLLVPCALIGIPTGAFAIRRLDPETFRRICMSFDAWVVGFGLSRTLIELKLMESPWAYSVMVATILIDVCLLYIFFTVRRANTERSRVSWVLPTTSSESGRGDRMSFEVAELSRDRFESLNRSLGYVIGIMAILMLAHTFLSSARLPS
ncbi:hypothetical protein [Bradyrhizobium sp. NAS80.1]|uniref:hypothetical protein n=1 Tax=Bradyrhizobium sp. NAS80.1 TaxID=1680159 RepID=UPI000B0D5387|nr:hypothetical protein [Bradyrhizobium sp. NAS80.1]